jgi:hypothetical protein
METVRDHANVECGDRWAVQPNIIRVVIVDWLNLVQDWVTHAALLRGVRYDPALRPV